MKSVKRIQTEDEFQRARIIRTEVFINEQGVPEELEYDEYDATATHVLAMCDNEPVGCGRVYIIGKTGKMGRIAVKKAQRKQGYGRIICNELMAVAKELGAEEVKLGAQLTAVPFYKTLGFIEEGDVYEEAGIDHITMRKKF